LRHSLEAWQFADNGTLDTIAPIELDRVSDSLVKLLAAWQDVPEKKFESAIGKAATAEEVATKSALHVWDELANSAYDNAVHAMGRKFKISQADLTNAGRLKKEGEKYRRAGFVLYEKDDYAAIKDYKRAGALLKESVEEAALAKFSVSGKTLATWLQIVLFILTFIAATVSIVLTTRSYIAQDKQIPSDIVSPADINETNPSK